jgi:hypothetical protein
MSQPNGLHAGSGLGETHSVSGGIREKPVHVGRAIGSVSRVPARYPS